MRDMGAEVDFRRPRRMMVAESRMERTLVMMKDKRVPAPATPASVVVVSGIVVQLNGIVA